MSLSNKKSILSGTMITAGTAIGAGMFSLPVVSSGMWLIFSLFSMLLIWFLNYLAAIYLLEANVQFEPGASYDTIVKKILGKSWNTMIGLSIAFLLYILLYAYFSAFGSIISNVLDWQFIKNVSWSQGLLGLLFGGFLAVIVWFSTGLVGRISTILVFGMVITFIVSMFGLSLKVEAVNLFNKSGQHSDYIKYIWAALPYYMTSFGFASIVPSLYKYFGKKPVIIKKSILFGSILALLVYCLFIFVAFGNVSRDTFIVVNKAGGNIAPLVNALTHHKNSQILTFSLNIFSNFAIITSFLGVGLCIFDYIADKFKFAETPKSRFYVACITFLPSGIASFFFPNGFIEAIGFAGLVLIFGYFIAPYLMVIKTRHLKSTGSFKVKGGKLILNFFLISSLLIAVFHVLGMLNYLPKW